MQENEVGDLTNFVVIFGGELLHQAEALVRAGLHPSDIITGFTKAGDKAIEIINELSAKSIENIRDIKEVNQALKSVLGSKLLGNEAFLTPLVAKACISVCPTKDPSRFNVDNVRVLKIPGASLSDSVLLEGFAIDQDALGTIRHATDCKVAVFAGGIESAKTETKGTVLIENDEEMLNFSIGEEKAMADVIIIN